MTLDPLPMARATQEAAKTRQVASQVLDAAGQLAKQAEALRHEVDKFLAEVRAA